MDKKLELLPHQIDKHERNKPGIILIDEIQAGANTWDKEHTQELQRGSKKDCRKKSTESSCTSHIYIYIYIYGGTDV